MEKDQILAFLKKTLGDNHHIADVDKVVFVDGTIPRWENFIRIHNEVTQRHNVQNSNLIVNLDKDSCPPFVASINSDNAQSIYVYVLKEEEFNRIKKAKDYYGTFHVGPSVSKVIDSRINQNFLDIASTHHIGMQYPIASRDNPISIVFNGDHDQVIANYLGGQEIAKNFLGEFPNKDNLIYIRWFVEEKVNGDRIVVNYTNSDYKDIESNSYERVMDSDHSVSFDNLTQQGPNGLTLLFSGLSHGSIELRQAPNPIINLTTKSYKNTQTVKFRLTGPQRDRLAITTNNGHREVYAKINTNEIACQDDIQAPVAPYGSNMLDQSVKVYEFFVQLPINEGDLWVNFGVDCKPLALSASELDFSGSDNAILLDDKHFYFDSRRYLLVEDDDVVSEIYVVTRDLPVSTLDTRTNSPVDIDVFRVHGDKLLALQAALGVEKDMAILALPATKVDNAMALGTSSENLYSTPINLIYDKTQPTFNNEDITKVSLKVGGRDNSGNYSEKLASCTFYDGSLRK